MLNRLINVEKNAVVYLLIHASVQDRTNIFWSKNQLCWGLIWIRSWSKRRSGASDRTDRSFDSWDTFISTQWTSVATVVQWVMFCAFKILVTNPYTSCDPLVVGGCSLCSTPQNGWSAQNMDVALPSVHDLTCTCRSNSNASCTVHLPACIFYVHLEN